MDLNEEAGRFIVRAAEAHPAEVETVLAEAEELLRRDNGEIDPNRRGFLLGLLRRDT